MALRKLERSCRTPPGWRLATVEEAKVNLELIKRSNLLEKWDRARLLNGWIGGSAYDFTVQEGFRSCLGYMLVVESPTPEIFTDDRNAALYSEVPKLSEEGRSAALLLCSEDWNEEVLFWLMPGDTEEDRARENAISLWEGDGPKVASKVVSAVARVLQNLHAKLRVSRTELSLASLEAFRKCFRGIMQALVVDTRESLQALKVEFQESDEGKTTNDILEELFQGIAEAGDEALDSFESLFTNIGLDTSMSSTWEAITDVVWYFMEIFLVAIILCWLCDNLYENVVMHSEEKDDCPTLIASLICYSYHFLSQSLGRFEEVLEEAAKEANGDCKRCAEILCSSILSFQVKSDALSTFLVRAVKKGNVIMVKSLIKNGVQPSKTDYKGKTALHYAAELEDESNRLQIAQMLLAATEESLANEFDSKKRTPLHAAVEKGHAEICKLLIENKASVTSKDEGGNTPLHYAAELEDESNGLKIAQMLLAATEEGLANEFDSEQRTPLHSAVTEGHAGMCKLLIENKASVTSKDEDGWTPLHYAFGLNENIEEVIRLLISAEREDSIEGSLPLVDIKDNEQKTPLDCALKYNAPVSMVGWLLSLSRQPESYFKKLHDLSLYLRESSRLGYQELVEKLLNGGADPVQGDDEGKTALHYAAEGADEDVARRIIDKLLSDEKQGSANVDKASVGDKYGRNVLHIAAFLGRKWLCRWLLDLDRKMIDAKDRDGQSAVFYVVAGAHEDPYVLDVFISKKHATNQVFVKDFSQTTPLHVAAARGNLNMVKALLSQISEQGRKKNYVEAPDVLGQTALHKAKISEQELKKNYVEAADVLGQTALHKAASGGHEEVVKVLLANGAHPLRQRDYDGKTALHFAAQAEGQDAVKIAGILLESCKSDNQKSMLLFASAVGIGKRNPSLEKYLDQEKGKILETLDQKNLLRVAARLGDIDMTREFISRGANIALIRNDQWRAGLPTAEERNNVENVIKQLHNIVEQGTDKPARRDTLGRSPFATGLAALFLNPFVKSPVTVGISGEWGMGKSSVMLQTESILLQTAAQLAFTNSFQKDNFLGAGESRLSRTGQDRRREIEKAIERLDVQRRNGSIRMFIERAKNFAAKVPKTILHRSKDIEERRKKQVTQQTELEKPSKVIGLQNGSKLSKFWNAVRAIWTKSKKLHKFDEFLGNYQPKYHHFFKSLAIMDRHDMFEEEEGSGSANQTFSEMPWEEDSIQGTTPSILTVRYNAWHYRNESEAWAGLAVEITKELEATMNVAHKLRTSWIYNWRNRKNNICFGVILPCFLGIVVAIWFTIIVWLLLDTVQNKDIKKFKYGGLPASMIVTAWGVGKSVISFVKPISTQVVDYICLPDHSQKLGYHQKVIDDINFLKEQLCYRPSWMWKLFSFIWCCITFSWDENYMPGTMIRKMPPAFSNNLRIIVFVDDLDRCEENVILQVLSAVNLVLAACEINVILSMENSMIQRAILRKYGNRNSKPTKYDEDLADKYLRKIVQLPLPLPDPSDKESNDFLQSQLGMWDSSKGSTDPEAERERYGSSGRRKANPKFQIKTSVPSGTSVPKKPKLGRRETLKYLAETGAKQQRAPSFSDTVQKRLGKTEDQEAIEKPEGSGIEEAKIEIDEQSADKTQKGSGKMKKQETIEKSGMISSITQIYSHVCALLYSCNVQSHNLQSGGEAKIEIDDTAGIEHPSKRDEQGEPEQREDSKCERSSMNLSSITRAMLIPKYSKGERDAFRFLHTQSTRSRKLPREWKCLMAYHRLAWNILSLTTDVVPVEGWQVQLIAWIFVCWHWRHLMTTLIENWNNLGVLKKWKAEEGPSLREIVEHYIDERWPADERSDNFHGDSTSKKKDDATEEVKKNTTIISSEETKEKDDAIDKLNENVDDNSSSSTKELEKTTDNLAEENTTIFSAEDTEEVLIKLLKEQTEMREILRKVLKEQEEMREVLRKSLKEQEKMREVLGKSLKEEEEMREMIKKKVLKEEEDKKGEISVQQGTTARENQRIIIKKVFINEEDNEGESSLQQYTMAEENQKTEEEREEWNKLRDTLRSHNVSMDGIQAFQKFRFYCEPGYLPWPLPKQA